MTDTNIVKRATVEELVGHRNRAIECFNLAMQALKDADAAFLRAVSPQRSYGMAGDFYPRRSNPDDFRRTLDGAVWKNLLLMTSLRDLMDVDARKKFDEQCDKNPPDVTVDNVCASMAKLMGEAGDIFLRSIVSTFEALPRDYRSNDGFKYGKRLVFDRAISLHTWNNGGKMERSFSFYHHCGTYVGDRLHDLDRIFHVLDDKPPPSWNTGSAQAVTECCDRGEVPFDIKTAYFRIKGFVNGNIHVWPLNEKLTRKANELLAAHYGWALGDGRQAA